MLGLLRSLAISNIAWLLAYTAIGQAFALATYGTSSIHLPFRVEVFAILASGILAGSIAGALDRQRRAAFGASGGLALLLLLARTHDTPARLSILAGAGAIGLLLGAIAGVAVARVSSKRRDPLHGGSD